MQAVILAAGRGTRMEELTTALPKPMLLVNGKTLLEHKFDALPNSIEDVVLVVGYRGDVIRTKYAGAYRGHRLQYVEQTDLNGTAGALWSAQPLLKGKFLVLNGDDIFSTEDLQKCSEESDTWKLLVQETKEMHRAGSVEIDAEARISEIVEGDLGKSPGIASTNMFSLDVRLFTQPLVPKQPGSLEYGLPQTVVAAAKALGIGLEPIFTLDWIQINSPGDLAIAAQILHKTA